MSGKKALPLPLNETLVVQISARVKSRSILWLHYQFIKTNCVLLKVNRSISI